MRGERAKRKPRLSGIQLGCIQKSGDGVVATACATIEAKQRLSGMPVPTLAFEGGRLAMSGTALPRRRPSSLTVAVAVSLAVHAMAAVITFGPGKSRDPIIEPMRAVPLRLFTTSKPDPTREPLVGAPSVEPLVPSAKPAPQPVIKQDVQPPLHAHPHPHAHPHVVARGAASTPNRASAAKPAATRASEAVATPVPHGDEPRLPSQPLESGRPESASAVAAAPSIPATAVAPAEPAPQAQPAVPAPVLTAAVASPARASGNDERIEPPHYNVAYLNNPKPDYPAAARRMRLQGEVIVRAMVEPSGRAGDLKIQRSSGVELLDEAALRAVRDYRFVPARRGAEAVTHWVDIPFAFRLSE